MMPPPTPPAPPDPEWCAFCSVGPVAPETDDDIVAVPGGFLCSFCADALTVKVCTLCRHIHGVEENMAAGVLWVHA